MMLNNIKRGTMDNINIFSVITIMSFFIAMPVVLLTEGVRFTPAAIAAHTGSAAAAQKARARDVAARFVMHAAQWRHGCPPRSQPARADAAAARARAQVTTLIFLGGLCFHTYQQVSYLILQRVEPVTHAVGNCVKRVVVIVSSIIFFQTPVSPINGFGTALALAGVFGYSRAKQATGKPGSGGGD